MKSRALTEHPVSALRAHVGTLLVLWQHPQTRQIHPIGRLDHDGELYRFVYTIAASQVEDFRPLPGLGAIGDLYESESLPSIFMERVMDSERSDFGKYVETLGLTPEKATPWEQITESGGERAGDTLQFMSIPEVAHGTVHAKFLTSGIRHMPAEQPLIRGVAVSVSSQEHEDTLMALDRGDIVELVEEDDNPKDPAAVLVMSRGTPLGWVPRFLAPSIRALLREGPVTAHVARVNGPASPSHLRLVLEVDSPAPEGFAFDPDGSWEPA